MKFFAALVLQLAVGATMLFSQATTTSRLDGTVTDTQGAVVPGAQVQAVMTGTDQTFKVTTDEKGYWVIPSLQSGTYKVTVSHQGFKTAAAGNVKLDAGVPASLNVTMEVGALTETIEVSAGAEIVQSDTAAVSST